MKFVCVQCGIAFVQCACWCTVSILQYMYVKVLIGLPEIPFFSEAVETHSCRRTIQRSAFVVTQLIVPGGVLLCVYTVCVPVYVHQRVLAAWYK